MHTIEDHTVRIRKALKHCKAISNQADNLSVFGVPVITRDWMPDDAVLLINAPKEES